MTGRFVKRFQYTCQGILVFLVTAIILHAADKKGSLSTGSVQNFSLTDIYPENPNQVRSRITGKSARSINQGQDWLLEVGKLETYYPDGKTNLVLETPQCVWNLDKRIAASTNRLEAQQGDNLFRIKGVGWSWHRSNVVLVISNQVETVIDKSRLPTTSKSSTNNPITNPTVDPDKPLVSQDMKINSNRFRFEYSEGIALYEGNVIAMDEQKTIRCDRMRVEFETGEGLNQNVKSIRAEGNVQIDLKSLTTTGKARSSLAIYRIVQIAGVTNNILELSGTPKPTWESEQYSGEGVEMIMHLDENRVETRGSAVLRFPRKETVKSKDKPDEVTEKLVPVVVTSDTNNLDMKSREARFIGNVIAKDPAWNLTCKTLTTFLAPTNSAIEKVIAEGDVYIERTVVKKDNASPEKSYYRARKITAEMDPEKNVIHKMIAETGVVFEQGKHSARGEAAYHTIVNDVEIVELTGNPTWKTEGAQGSAEVLQFKNDYFKAQGNARFRRESPIDQTGETKPASAISKGAVEVMSREYEYHIKKNEAVFRKDVKAVTEAMVLQCGLLTVKTKVGKQEFDELIAEENVVIVREKGKAKATCDRAVYVAATELLELTGRPIIQTDKREITDANILIWNLAKNTLIGHGGYKMKGDFEALTLPKDKKTSK